MTLFTLSLGIVSTTFVLLAVTSKRWAVLRIFVGASDWTWANPICIINSSPFYHCGYPNLTFDATSNKSTCNVPNCQFYRAHGWDSTSCRLPRETGQSVNDLNANAQVCQQGMSSENELSDRISLLLRSQTANSYKSYDHQKAKQPLIEILV